jgi:hypothetical protein
MNCERYSSCEVVTVLDLFADDNKAVYAIWKVINNLCTLQQLWVLFVHLLVNDYILTPLTIWHDFCNNFAYDYILQSGNMDDIGWNLTLQELSAYLEEYGKSLVNYGPRNQSHTCERLSTEWSAGEGTHMSSHFIPMKHSKDLIESNETSIMK